MPTPEEQSTGADIPEKEEVSDAKLIPGTQIPVTGVIEITVETTKEPTTSITTAAEESFVEELGIADPDVLASDLSESTLKLGLNDSNVDSEFTEYSVDEEGDLVIHSAQRPPKCPVS